MTQKPKCYISGPMSGLRPDEYRPRFAAAASLLRERGYDVWNPADSWTARLLSLVSYRLALSYDLWQLSRCTHIYKMPGWRASRGANIESCWAYHFGAWTLPKALAERLNDRIKAVDTQYNIHIDYDKKPCTAISPSK